MEEDETKKLLSPKADVLAETCSSHPSYELSAEQQIDITTATMKDNGKADKTILTTKQKLRQIAKHCNLGQPEQVKHFIANARNEKTDQLLNNATKAKFSDAYDNYCKANQITWQKPRYKIVETTPLIPTTENVNVIISNASRKYITIFTIMAQEGFAPKEMAQITRQDVDAEQGIMRVKGIKGHDSATRKLKPQTAEMLRAYLQEHKEEPLFPNEHAISQVWTDTRKRTTKKLCKPELNNIQLRNLRNYSGAQLYKTLPIRDPIAVMRHLRHKKLDTTMHYLRAINTDYEQDEQYISRTSTTIEEDTKLIDNGFQYVTERNGTKLYRKRK